MKKMKKISVVFVALAVLFMAAAFCGVSEAAEGRVWVVWEVGEDCFSYEDVKVYTEPNLQADIVAILEDETPVYIDRVRVLRDEDDEYYEIYEAWWYITSPVAGWVERFDLWLGDSGYLFRH